MNNLTAGGQKGRTVGKWKAAFKYLDGIAASVQILVHGGAVSPLAESE
jgi:hypothetical protein